MTDQTEKKDRFTRWDTSARHKRAPAEDTKFYESNRRFAHYLDTKRHNEAKLKTNSLSVISYKKRFLRSNDL
jgi:hypothetical protein